MKSDRTYPIYKVNKKAEASLVGGHPWVYENDILAFPESEPENGTLADVVSTKGAYLGTGFVSLKSKIRVRLIPATPTIPSTPASGGVGWSMRGPTVRPSLSRMTSRPAGSSLVRPTSSRA